MININRVVLVGRLTRDVEVRKTGSGLSVAQFTVAVDRRMPKNSDGQQSADFVPCVAWRQSADFLGSYARKGNLVSVEGRIQTRSYDNSQGQKVYVTEVICDNLNLIGSRNNSDQEEQPQKKKNDYGSGIGTSVKRDKIPALDIEFDDNSIDPNDLPF